MASNLLLSINLTAGDNPPPPRSMLLLRMLRLNALVGGLIRHGEVDLLELCDHAAIAYLDIQKEFRR